MTQFSSISGASYVPVEGCRLQAVKASSHPILVCIHAFETKCHKNRTDLVWPRSRVVDNTTKHLNLDPQCSIPPSDVVRDLGVLLDCKLNMTQHVSSTARTCFFHLRRIRQVR